jgi:hypothetical protein
MWSIIIVRDKASLENGQGPMAEKIVFTRGEITVAISG